MIQIIQEGVPIARVELLDEMAIKAVNENNGLEYKETPTLFFEFHGGSSNEIKEQAAHVKEICAINKGTDFNMELDDKKRELLWRARHKAYYSTLALRPGSKALTTDICVPISKLASVIVKTKKEFDETGLIYTLVGHVGDGNFHLLLLQPYHQWYNSHQDPLERRNDEVSKMHSVPLSSHPLPHKCPCLPC